MPSRSAVFEPTFSGPNEGQTRGTARGRRPVIFDILGPDQETSLLPGDLKLVLHVNPRSMQLTYAKNTVRTQTRGGFVEFHWGDAAEEITFDAATGGFMRLFTGLSNITGSRGGAQGRRETIAYDKYLDLLALFHNNGAIYDVNGNVVVQGYVKVSFDGGVHIGWFDGDFTVNEDANVPFMFSLSTRFIIDREIMSFRSGSIFDSQTIASPEVATGDDGTSTAVVDPFVRRRRANPISLELDRDEEGNVIF